jgi:hypothetical protein
MKIWLSVYNTIGYCLEMLASQRLSKNRYSSNEKMGEHWSIGKKGNPVSRKQCFARSFFMKGSNHLEQKDKVGTLRPTGAICSTDLRDISILQSIEKSVNVFPCGPVLRVRGTTLCVCVPFGMNGRPLYVAEMMETSPDKPGLLKKLAQQ